MASRIPRWRPQVVLWSMLAAISSVRALDITYCSSQNTGGSSSISSIYMSNGKCYDQCIASYAYAVLQGDLCWCSNLTPAETTSTNSCNEACPGYPSDTCGNRSNGLYGYIKLNVAPSGTAAGSSTSTSTAHTSAAAPTTSSTLFTSQSSQTSSDSPTTSEISSAATQQSSPSDSTTTPITSVQTVTQSGNIIIQTVTSTPTSVSAAQGNSDTKKSSSASPGIIAAAVVASVVGSLVLAGVAFLLWRRKRKDDEVEKFGGLNDSPSPANLDRNASTHSKAGLLDRAYPPTITTRMSSHGGLEMSSSDAASPVTPSSERRSSRPLMYDQRLNPVMVLDNGSRTSINTIEDSRDYGRMLKVTNPDKPSRPSFS